MASMIPDLTRKVQGTAYIEPGDEYSQDGTCIGIGTRETIKYGRACGIAYASKLPARKVEFDEEFWADYLAH